MDRVTGEGGDTLEERILWKIEEKTMILWLSNPLREYFGKKKLIIGKTKREM